MDNFLTWLKCKRQRYLLMGDNRNNHADPVFLCFFPVRRNSQGKAFVVALSQLDPQK